MKRCSQCERELSEDQFHRSAHHPTGRYPSCKECKNAKNRANLGRALWRARKRVEAIAPTKLDLLVEEEYLMDRLALVRQWIKRLSKSVAVILALLVACSAPPVAVPFEDRVQNAAIGVVEPSDVVDLTPMLNVTLARATIQPEYLGAGEPPPTFAPSPGIFRQLRRECVDESGGRPSLMMRDTLPKKGKPFHLIAWSPGGRTQSILISTEASSLVDGTLLPHAIRGAPGCLAEVRPDSVTLLEPGRAEFDLILPPGSAGLRVFMQLATLAPDVNSAGLLTSQGYEMVIGQ